MYRDGNHGTLDVEEFVGGDRRLGTGSVDLASGDLLKSIHRGEVRSFGVDCKSCGRERLPLLYTPLRK